MRQTLLASNDLNNHFKQITNSLCVSKEETRSYITGIFNSYLISTNDLSKESIKEDDRLTALSPNVFYFSGQ
jgi:hypothetical protein